MGDQTACRGVGDQTVCRGLGARLPVEGWVGDQTLCGGVGGQTACRVLGDQTVCRGVPGRSEPHSDHGSGSEVADGRNSAYGSKRDCLLSTFEGIPSQDKLFTSVMAACQPRGS